MRLKIKSFKLDTTAKKIVLYCLGSGLLLAVYLININTLPPLNTAEQASSIGVDSGMAIANDITFAPQRAVDYLVFKLTGDEALYFRLVSILITFLAIAAFFILIRQWISLRVALIATALFATSSWVLHDARWAEPHAILLLGLPFLLLAGTLQKVKEYDPVLPLTSMVVALMLYIPGFWIFFITGITFTYKDIYEAWQEASAKIKVLWASGFILPLLPLVFGLSRPGALKNWLGLPEGGINISATRDNLVNLPEQLFINGIDKPAQWLYGTPVLDGVTAILFLTGLFYVLRDFRFPVRRLVLVLFGIFCLAFIGLMGHTYTSLLIPLVYIFAAFGITFLLDQWFHIFPKNPMARSLGVIAVSVLVFFSCTYHIFRYHHVWPRSDEFSNISEDNLIQ